MPVAPGEVVDGATALCLGDSGAMVDGATALCLLHPTVNVAAAGMRPAAEYAISYCYILIYGSNVRRRCAGLSG